MKEKGRLSRKMKVQKWKKKIKYAMEGEKKYNGRDERWEGKAITCTRDTEGRENDIKGREDLYDRSHYYVHYNDDGGRV